MNKLHPILKGAIGISATVSAVKGYTKESEAEANEGKGTFSQVTNGVAGGIRDGAINGLTAYGGVQVGMALRGILRGKI